MSEDLAFALERLADESRPVHQTNLAALSDVSRSQAPLFRSAWAQYSPERRLELARELVEQAEANIHLNFYAILRELLNDPDAEVRKLAIEGLWEDERPNLVTPLVGLLAGDPVAAVRAAAASSLGRFVMLGSLGEINEMHAEQAERALRAAWTRPHELTEVRGRALEGLAYSDAGDVREMIRVAYYDEDELLRQSAVYAMGRSADRRWAKYVLEELDSRDIAMRFEAAVAAGELALGAAVEPLIRLLDDTGAAVREAAASALGEIGGPAAKRALKAALESADDSLADAAETALEAMSFNSGGPSNVLFDFRDPIGALEAQAGRGAANGADAEGAEDEDEEADYVGSGRFEDRFDEDEDIEELDESYEVDEDAFEYDEDDLDWLDEDDEDDEDDGDDDEDADW